MSDLEDAIAAAILEAQIAQAEIAWSRDQNDVSLGERDEGKDRKAYAAAALAAIEASGFVVVPRAALSYVMDQADFQNLVNFGGMSDEMKVSRAAIEVALNGLAAGNRQNLQGAPGPPTAAPQPSNASKIPVSEVVERVASAIEDAMVKAPPGHGVELYLARAAIAAMREPTEAMLWAGGGEIPNVGTDAAPVWRAMIEVALNASKTPSG